MASGENPSGWPAGVTTSRVAVNGVELDVHEAGDPADPTVLLCHGFPELAYSWRHQMAPLAAAGYHVLAPDQRGYGRSSAPREVTAYGITELTGDLAGLLDHYGKSDAVYVGHDWGALIVWEAARLTSSRVRAVVGVSVPFVQWPGRPTDLFKMLYGDRFFYMLYFQQVGPAERELEADPRRTMASVLYGASGVGFASRDVNAEVPPMEGTGFLTMMPPVPPLPLPGPEGGWLSAADLEMYTSGYEASGFFGPVSYYRNLDANYELVKDLSADLVTMPSWFIAGADDPVLSMDATGVERMKATLPDFRGHSIIPGAGHWTQQEAPQAFNEALLGFLAGLS
ncbi:MAG: alpha/beta hydrolase [Ilumatobacteraceae bacterium]